MSKINWVEIPVANMERAVEFYTSVFQKKMHVFDADESRKLALMPPGAGLEESIEPVGSLLQVENFQPHNHGTIIYFDPSGDLDGFLKRVESAGGAISFPKFRIGNGYLATFTDSEGNTVGVIEWDADDENAD